MFENFSGYIKFFLLDELIDENKNIKFHLTFEDFQSLPTFSNISEYLLYKKGVMRFIKSRNRRIEKEKQPASWR
ncbi:DUF6994 family protein [Proteiniphilum sp. UBA5384]|uniref:DUF6994 family protein n=1 Tax=Proteiniphilum sp. UBA5384 TaxID=1947279 RepID=UPI0039C9DB67